jgi:hypothetical protein
MDVCRESLDELLAIAMRINDEGTQEARLIIGPDDFRLDKTAIADRIFLERSRLKSLRVRKY